MGNAKGRRAAPKPPKAHKPIIERKHITIPIFIFIVALAVGPAASNWASESKAPIVPTISPAPTLVVTEPSVAPIPVSPDLTFATYNIAKPTNNQVPKWANRREAIAKTINESNSDVVGLQEATANMVTGVDGKRMTHWDDVQALTAPAGYVSAKIEVNTCGGNYSCIHSAHILYRTASVKQLEFSESLPSAGQGTLSDITDGLKYAKKREFSWAYLEGLNGTGPFLAVSVHLNNETSKVGKADRQKLGTALTPWVEALNKERGLEGIPMVLMGDFNSYAGREPKGMAYQLMQSGWTDSFNASTDAYQLFAEAYTTSYTKGNRSGWPKKPITSGNPVRIDYIMFKGPGLRSDIYAVSLKLNADGTFDNSYRGSDHMMVQTVIHFDNATPAPSATP
jgi:endonuclease/exonuclease/phosphatase family metal-dependent hydrolase